MGKVWEDLKSSQEVFLRPGLVPCGRGTSKISIQWELVINAESWAHSTPAESKCHGLLPPSTEQGFTLLMVREHYLNLYNCLKCWVLLFLFHR